ncbi:DUF4185 domain-containing protein [Planctomicrobium sp. SH664]|uniref:DUF4185 domain-containing protein n=1 Tax=Planctomicrobium sp. SH664 TaxID=3448125 RepID=UPI003F5B023A
MTRPCTLIVLILFTLPLQAGPPVIRSARPAPDLDALFQQTSGWIGADGAYSVAGPESRTLWLFSDTFVGSIEGTRRIDSTLVNNTVGVQEGIGGPIRFFIRKDSSGEPAALLTPADGIGWFWMQAGVQVGNRLWLFLTQVERQTDDVFGFRLIGQWLAVVSNPDAPPLEWQVRQIQLPNTLFLSQRTLSWGAALLKSGDDLYIYGTDEQRQAGAVPNRQLIVARVPGSSVGDLTTWRYFSQGKWVSDFRLASPLAGLMGTEFSVTPLGDEFLLITTESGLSPRVIARTSSQPAGPWSAPSLVYTSTETSRDKNLFCYAAKAHPTLSTPDEVVISYVVNSFDFSQLTRDATLYWPRFVRVQIESSPPQR